MISSSRFTSPRAESFLPPTRLSVSDASFVLGSAIKHPRPQVLAYYSVHTSSAALAQGKAEINQIGQGFVPLVGCEAQHFLDEE
jgi:hypothetical protein